MNAADPTDGPGVGPDPAEVTRLTERRAALVGRIVELSGAERASGISVVAVSKTRPASTVLAAIAAGFTDFGENYAAEFAAKAAAVAAAPSSPAPTWHFIGQLQTNKVKVVAPWASVFQTADRSSLVEALARRVPGARVLVQVNLAGLEGRGGVSWDQASALAEQAADAGLSVEGLMGVAPIDDHPAAAGSPTAAAFGRLRALCDRLGLEECSMGMSGDFEVALAEGSTMIRIGSAIFGERTR